MKIKLLLIVIVVAFSLTAVMFTLTAHADFLKGMQYMTQQRLDQVPISQVTATDNTPSDDDRVTSIVVHFVNIQNSPTGVGSQITINSFQRLVGFSQTVQNYRTAPHISSNVESQFQLVDLPSKDKAQFYQLVSTSIQILGTNNNNQEINPVFDTKIDLITGDGTLLYTLEYDQCQVNAYWVYDDSNKQDYRMASEDQSEYREVTNFTCQGYHLDLPSNSVGSYTYSP
jgi:hypothetical protein